MICCCRPPPPINNNTHTVFAQLHEKPSAWTPRNFPLENTIRKGLSKTKITLQPLCHKSLDHVTNRITSWNGDITRNSPLFSLSVGILSLLKVFKLIWIFRWCRQIWTRDLSWSLEVIWRVYFVCFSFLFSSTWFGICGIHSGNGSSLWSRYFWC